MSMVDPSIDYLAEKVDSKYTLVFWQQKEHASSLFPV